MTRRKPLDARCTTGIDCPLEGHTEVVPGRGGRSWFRHVPLTKGQKRTHYERVMTASADPSSPPWDATDGCFGHCDPEGWHRPCRDHNEQKQR